MSGTGQVSHELHGEHRQIESRFHQLIIGQNTITDHANVHFGDIYHNSLQCPCPATARWQRVCDWLETFTATLAAFWVANGTKDFAIAIWKHTYLRLTVFGNTTGHRLGEVLRGCYDSVKVTIVLTLTLLGNFAWWYLAVQDGILHRDATRMSITPVNQTYDECMRETPDCGYLTFLRNTSSLTQCHYFPKNRHCSPLNNSHQFLEPSKCVETFPGFSDRCEDTVRIKKPTATVTRTPIPGPPAQADKDSKAKSENSVLKIGFTACAQDISFDAFGAIDWFRTTKHGNESASRNDTSYLSLCYSQTWPHIAEPNSLERAQEMLLLLH